MKIELHYVTIRELCDGYTDNKEGGVFALGGKLNVRPPYQREFVYSDSKRDAVIDTVFQGFPLNIMYWAKNEDGTFEIIDGQQRTISICQYVSGENPFEMRFFHNLQEDERERFLDYQLTVYLCEGDASEKLRWFERINIAGMELTKQELRNAVYSGPWITDAKRYFSKSGCPAQAQASDYLKGSAIRQDFLETAISWKSKKNIDIYMAKHQNDGNANNLWLYFVGVINWVEATFKKKTKYMKGIDWGSLYDKYKGQFLDADVIDKKIKELLLDDDVTNKAGIYYYVLNGDEKHLNIRAFTEAQKIAVFTKQEGKCPICGEHFDISFMEADHITPWSQGGKTSIDNCQMLCRECNRRKSNK